MLTCKIELFTPEVYHNIQQIQLILKCQMNSIFTLKMNAKTIHKSDHECCDEVEWYSISIQQ